MAFPASPLDLRAELNLAGTWTDVSGYAMQRDGIQAPVPVTRGRPDETAKATPGSAAVELNNRDGRFSPKNPLGAYYGQLGRNTPLRLSVPAQSNYLRLEGDNAAQASAADTAALHITGSIEMRIAVRLTDWQGAALAARSGAWTWYLTPAGLLALAWTDAGAVTHTAASTLPVPYSGQLMALRVTLDATTGNVTFSTAASIDGTYGQLGAVVNPTGAATSVAAASGAALQVGYNAGLASQQPAQLRGRVGEYRLYNGIGGSVAADTVMSAVSAGATSWTDSAGLAWTISGGAEVSGRDYRWHGETSSLPPRWDPTGTDIAVQVASGGLLRRLGQGTAPLQSPMRRAIGAQAGTLAPVQYWPCEDAAGATAFGSATGGQPMTFDGSPTFASDTAFPGSAPLPQLNGSRWQGRVPSYSSNGSLAVRALVHPGTAAAGTPIIQVITTGTCTALTAAYQSTISFSFTGTAGATTVFNSGAANFGAFLPGGVVQQPLWMSLELAPGGGSTVNWALTVLALGASTAVSSSGTFTGTIGNVTAVYVNPSGALTSWGAGHVQVQSAWASLFTLGGSYNGWAGEPAGQRFARVAGENGLAARVLGPASATALMGVQPVATLLEVLAECEAADRGMIYEPRQVLGVAYRTLGSMLNQPPAVTLDYSQARLGGTGAGLEPAYDDQFVRNDQTVTRSAPASDGMTYRYQLNDGSAMSVSQPPAGIGDYASGDSINCQLDAQVPDLASWIVHAGTADVARWPVIPVNLARPAIQGGGLYYPLLGLDCGDYLQVTHMLGQVTADPVPVIVSGARESLGGFHHELAFNCVPESPYEVIILDDPVYGRADTDGSTLAASASSGATSLSVATASGFPQWTANPADMPFDIAVAGERMTVTAISNAGLRGAAGFATGTNTTTLGVTFPASLQAGDLMLIWCAGNGGGAHTWTETPDGFTAVTATFGSGQATCQLLYKQATSADATKAAGSGTFTVTEASGGPDAWTAIAMAYDLTGGLDGTPSSSGATGSSAAPDARGIYTASSGDRLIWLAASGASTTGGLPTITPPAGFTTQVTQVSTATGSGTQICALAADATQYAPGWTGDAIGSLSASHGWAALLLAVTPGSSQTFTVTRAVNGVAKAQSSGADVRLWFPPILSLT